MDSGSPSDDQSASSDQGLPSVRGIRRFKNQEPQMVAGKDSSQARSPTWRGWLIGIGCVLLLCKLVPVCEFVVRGTRLTFVQLPYAPIVLIFALIIFLNVFIGFFRVHLRLTRQDLALIFCMTLMANHIPGQGFLTYFTMETSGSYFYATNGNEWAKWIHPHVPDNMVPHDPIGADDPGPRPIQWLYAGLPEGESIPYLSWIYPYAVWSLMLLLLYSLLFATCLLLRKQWSEREKLPFPLAQVPAEMWKGYGETGKGFQIVPFLKSPYARWGIGLVFLLHAWNGMYFYADKWPVIPRGASGFDQKFLTESPWSRLAPLKFSISPSIVGLTFLISKDISGSIVFFFVLLKVAIFVLVGFGFGQSHNEFMHTPSGWHGIFINQGMGALFALVLSGTWLARGALWRSLKQALGMVEGGDNHDEGLSIRTTWIVLVLSFAGLIGWLCWMNVGFIYAFISVVGLWVISTGVARLVAEGGTMSPQVTSTPIELTLLATPPAQMGVQSMVPLSMWSKITIFDQFRVSPMVSIMTSLEVGSLAGIKRRPLVYGMFGALLLSLCGSFFGFFHTLYSEPQAVNASWVLQKNPGYEFKLISIRSSQTAYYNQKVAALKAEGKELSPREIPAVAKRDYQTIAWIGIGMMVMFLMVFLRTRIFWLPHPIGYVLWMGQRSLIHLCFSITIGWAIKSAILKFGGAEMYTRWRGFFIGMIVGEATSAIFWIVVNGFTAVSPGYKV